jgi:hypothetical protein
MSDSKSQVPNFLTKLYCMVNDPFTDRFISWSASGDSFQVSSQDEFSKEVLPLFFKHSNFASFVRQLNMYGFHKVPSPLQGALLSSFDEIYEFTNPNFRKDHPEPLSLVTRKKSHAETNSVDLNHLIQQIVAIKRTQSNISNDLKIIKNDNQSLWNESLALRERYARQQDTIDKILGFLASIFSSKKPLLSSLGDNQANTGDKRKLVEVDDPPNFKKSKVGDELVSSYLQNLVQSHSQESDLSNDLLCSKVSSVEKDTNKVEKHLDLLQDHVIDVASLVGIDPDNFMNFHGTDQDRETLLSLMNNSNEIPFTVPESLEKYDTFLGDLGDDPLQEGM